VVLLHGGASDSHDWRATMAALSPYYTTFAPDIIGYGQSDRHDGGYYLSDFVAFARGFLEALDVAPHAFVGHSLGGRIWMEVIARHGIKAHSLVLVNSVGFTNISKTGTVLGTLAWWGRRMAHRRQPYPRFLSWNQGQADWLCLDQWKSIDLPTLIVWTQHDPYFSLEGAKKAVALLPQARLEIIPGYGHAPHVKKREVFDTLLLDFLGKDG
jgi:pimeloyl-ACP methyl ester carboxylesterase